MKNILLFTYSTNILCAFANHKYKELSYPQNQKMCDPILVTRLKMRPHYSQSSRENVTPSSGTSPLASYKEVPPCPPRCLSLYSTLSKTLAMKLATIRKKRWPFTVSFVPFMTPSDWPLQVTKRTTIRDKSSWHTCLKRVLLTNI